NNISLRVEAQVVGIIAYNDRFQCPILPSLEHPQRPVATVGNEQSIGRRNIGQSLRTFKTRDHMNDFARSEINDADAVNFQLGKEQPLPPQVDSHMVEPPPNIAKLDLAL